MSVLVTYGSKRGGAMGLAEMVATDLREEGLRVDLVPPNRVKRLDEHEAVVVGGALYASRWHRAAKRFVKRLTG
ncbi:MAG: flavodoxin domain-containing protein [Nocardioidaceae bacterium]